MRIGVSKMGALYTVVLVSMLVVTFSMAWADDQEKTILVTPFQINSEEPLDFLIKGIEKMIETRLTEPGRSTVIIAKDSQSGSSVAADYLIEGTILVFGTHVSTDVKLLQADSGNVELSFNEMGTQKGDVIRHIDLFAENVRTRVLGLQPSANQQIVQAPSADPMNAVAPSPTPAQAAAPAQQIWRGPYMRKVIDSIAVDDIDGDGKNEFLVLAENKVEIFRREGEGLMPVAETDITETNIRTVFLDTIDLDQDGQKEICITAIDDKLLRAASSVYRVENMRLEKMLGPVNYLLRVVDTAAGAILLGQKTLGENDRKLKSTVIELGLDPSGADLISPTGKSFPFADNVFGIAFGDFMNDGTETIAVLDLSGIISLYSRDGKEIYRGSDEYGGSPAYIEFKGMRYTKDDGYVLERIYFQQPIFAVNEGGKTGLAVVKNVDSTQGLLSLTRVYNKGYLDRLLWNKLGFIVQDKGQSLSGYISDFCLGDTNGDGKEEVVFALVSPFKLFKDRRSQVFSQQLP